jgi:uncharacterized protein (TIGR02996 family)
LSLLDEVFANPADDGPRLVYADWLLEQPEEIDRARGELIQIQIREGPNEELHTRAQELKSLYARGWFNDVYVRRWDRGFPTSVWCNCFQLEQLNGQSRRAEMALVESMTIDDGGVRVGQLLDALPLQSLSALELEDRWPLDAFASVVSSARFARLRSFSARGTKIDNEHVQVLAASSAMSGVTDLALDSNSITDVGARLIAGSPYLASVERLGLSRNYITEAGVAALAASPHLTKLRAIGLYANPLPGFSPDENFEHDTSAQEELAAMFGGRVEILTD